MYNAELEPHKLHDKHHDQRSFDPRGDHFKKNTHSDERRKLR